jgi:GTP-binding protein HflX
MLILDIFAKHAVTGEGKLQVEIAQLKYTAPRLTGRGIDLSRQGGTSGSIGSRGPGETKLETDKRHIQRRILALKSALSEMEKDRSTKRSKRIKSNVPLAVISGYTNAGKSTLLNYLTDANILAEDKLFATLDPTVRKLTLPSGRNILLSDTVGFISRLPHGLVEAFKSTLEEVKYADLIIHLVDSSNSEIEKSIEVVNKLIGELNEENKPVLTVFNKCDVKEPPLYLTDMNSVNISVKNKMNIDGLIAKIEEILFSSKKKIKVLIPFTDGGVLGLIYKNATVSKEETVEDGFMLDIVCDEEIYNKVKGYIYE